MSNQREKSLFPTRSPAFIKAAPGAEADIVDDVLAEVTLEAGRVYRAVRGLDELPRPMTDEELATLLRDPFAELLLKRGVFPQTLRELLAAFDSTGSEAGGLPEQTCFLVAEGGQIPWTEHTPSVRRGLRFAVVRRRGNDVPVMVSASTLPDSAEQFLQLIGWDDANGVFHFYERRAGTWFWAGNSHHSLAAATRGQGPFDSHVNGSMVMKELRAPWNNWHSMNAVIRDDVLAPDDPLRDDPLFQSRTSAHELETFVVRPGVERWNRARFAAASAAAPGRAVRRRLFFRQLLETTTVNLTSSSQESRQIEDEDRLDLPHAVLPQRRGAARLHRARAGDHPRLGRGPAVQRPAAPLRVRAHRRLILPPARRQPSSPSSCRSRPSRISSMLALLLQQRVISRRFAACLLMVDFPNPVFSERRAALMRYVPETARLDAPPGRPDAQRHRGAVRRRRRGAGGAAPRQPRGRVPRQLAARRGRVEDAPSRPGSRTTSRASPSGPRPRRASTAGSGWPNRAAASSAAARSPSSA